MSKEVILALVLTALFFGAIVWLVVYSHRQQHGAARREKSAHPAPRQRRQDRAMKRGGFVK